MNISDKLVIISTMPISNSILPILLILDTEKHISYKRVIKKTSDTHSSNVNDLVHMRMEIKNTPDISRVFSVFLKKWCDDKYFNSSIITAGSASHKIFDLKLEQLFKFLTSNSEVNLYNS